MNTLLFALCVLSAPFEDTHKRFVVDLPDGWQFAPMPGDLYGAAFRRVAAGTMAFAGIRVIPVDPGMDLAAVVQEVDGSVRFEPGFQSLKDEASVLAGAPAWRKRYVVFVAGDPKISKMVEQRLFVHDGKAHIINVETMAEVFGTFEADFEKIFASFRPLGKKGVVFEGPPQNKVLVGRWIMDADRTTVLEFFPDATFQLDTNRGVFEVKGSTVITRMPGGQGEAFEWSIKGDVLVMRQPSIKQTIRYAREGSAAVLVGTWVSPDHTLQLSPTGVALVDGSPGNFSAEGSQLLFRFKDGRQMAVTYELKGQELVVSGGRFGDKLKLKRKK